MYSVKSDFLNILMERGLFNQASDLEGLDKKLCAGPIIGYLGSDPTADSLHVGNLAALTLLRWFQKTGNKPIALIGGATGRIGDPSGRSSERPIMTDEVFAKNLAGIKKSMEKFFHFGDGKTDAILVNNYDWFKDITYMDFLTKYGRYFSVNEMLKRESVKLRLDREQPLSFLEFNYALFQAYDFVEINKRYGAIVQFGGGDQWGNIVSGVDLGKRFGIDLYALTIPLLTDANGVKFGKSMGNAIWLNEDKLSSYDYYQFWRNIDDRDVEKLLKIFTDLPMDEIAKLAKLQGAEINEAKKILAFEATKLCRGEEEARKAEATAKETFENGGMGQDLPTFDMSSDLNIVDALVSTSLCKSKSDARRMIQANAISVNDTKITDPAFTISNDMAKDGKILLSSGKKNKVVLKVK
ncbi:MAG: tyrosine--tRNA ligase [Alphaproteobacteria bacterium]|nr:tyrosine--tRNA ligase [Alphaproteobacteria bacterium]